MHGEPQDTAGGEGLGFDGPGGSKDEKTQAWVDISGQYLCVILVCEISYVIIVPPHDYALGPSTKYVRINLQNFRPPSPRTQKITLYPIL